MNGSGRPMRRLVVFVLLAAPACATDDRVHRLEERVARLEERAAALDEERNRAAEAAARAAAEADYIRAQNYGYRRAEPEVPPPSRTGDAARPQRTGRSGSDPLSGLDL